MLQGSPTHILYADTDIQQNAPEIAEGIYDLDGLPGMLASVEAPSSRMIGLGAENIGQERARGVIIEPLLDGANDAPVVVGIFGVNPVKNRSGGKRYGLRIDKIGDVVVTASTLTVPKAIRDPSDAGDYRLADTLAYTPAAFGSTLEAAFGSAPSFHSPADDTAGRIMLFDAYGYQSILLDPAGAPGFNALYRLVT